MGFLKMKEPANTITHFIPFLSGIVAIFFLIAASSDDTSNMLVSVIFGISVITLYGASSAYHWIRTTPKKEKMLRKFDHMAIYFLIAGSYTPVLYYGLEGAWRTSLMSIIWTLAIIGMVIKLWFMGLPRWVSTAFYLLLGWFSMIPMTKLVHSIPSEAITLLVLSGVSYSIGAVIYGTKKLNFFPGKFGFHEIFHLFVACGTTLHYIMVYSYLLPISKV